VFDLAIIDEADAFPYYGSEALAASVSRALAPGGRTAVLTATPSLGHMARIRAGAFALFQDISPPSQASPSGAGSDRGGR